MALFEKMLSSEESLFKNELVLDFSFMPKVIPFRETQQRFVASCIQPLFQKRNGKNVFVFGPPGVGKTVALKHVVGELEEQTEEIIPLYLNCWQKNSTFKIYVELCEQLGYPYTQNKGTEDLFKVVKNQLNKRSAVLVFDEIDKVEDMDFLYAILEEVFRKSIIVVTNYPDWLQGVEERVRSRLMLQQLEFKPYNAQETRGILQQRVEHAFFPDVVQPDAFEAVLMQAVEKGDIRIGLTLLREAGMIAEDKASRKISGEHVKEAMGKFAQVAFGSSKDLDGDMQMAISLIQKNGSVKMGDLFEHYQKAGGKSAYRTLARKINKLGELHFLDLEKKEGGSEGTTTIVSCPKEKKLSEF
ncbi:AAA family ATPase [Candidatus Woesearchaeota archaeon]|nr:AAA family ATPase [Candidatus Woesearchaeota archaeon]